MDNPEKLKSVLYGLVWSWEYGVGDDLHANGCEHGFKPAAKCPNEGCEKRNLHLAINEALEGWSPPRLSQ